MTIRWFTFVFLEKGPADFPFYKIVHYIVIRILLNAEFFYYFYTGHLALWVAQFTATVWWNLFLIVSSHDFDLDAAKADPTNDWGTFQIGISTDIAVTGNVYVDGFLTAGLGCHRVHHLLPG